MTRFLSMKRLSILFFGIFAVLVTGTLIFQNQWIAPGERCEREGKWYDIETRICATPISIAEITGRPIGVSRAEASAEKNRELVDIERRLAEGREAQNTENARQLREALSAPPN